MIKLTLIYKNSRHVYRMYMPFICPFGLFVETKQALALGQHVLIDYSLPDKTVAYDIEAQVVWINPANGIGGKPDGVGIKFLTNQDVHMKNLQRALPNDIDPGNLTCTM